MREEHYYVEDFRYVCCDKVLDSSIGCVIARHEAHPDQAKAIRTMTKDDNSTNEELDEEDDKDDEERCELSFSRLDNVIHPEPE